MVFQNFGGYISDLVLFSSKQWYCIIVSLYLVSLDIFFVVWEVHGDGI